MKPLLLITFIVLIAAGLITGRIMTGRREGQIARDIERLADVREIQAGFERLWLEQKSYSTAGTAVRCQTDQDVRSCQLPGVGDVQAGWVDPLGSAYLVLEAPTDEEYAVGFQLEASYGDLAAGAHQLNAQGIQ